MTDAPQSIYVATEGEPVAWMYIRNGCVPYVTANRHAGWVPRSTETPLYASPRISTEPFPGAVEYRKGVTEEAARTLVKRWMLDNSDCTDTITRKAGRDLIRRIVGAHLPTSEGDAQ